MGQRSVPFIIATIIVATCAGADSRLVQAQSSGPRPEAGSTSAFQVTVKPLTRKLTTYVQVKRTPTLTVRARRPGVLLDVAVMPGSRVSEGQVVARLGGAAMASALKQAKVAVKSAQAALRTEQSSLDLAKQLAKAHISSRREIYQATLARDRARAEVADASAQLQNVQAQQVLRAPKDGIVSATPAVSGNSVNAGDAVVVIQPGTRVWLAGQIFGPEVQQVRVGQTGTFTPSDGASSVAVKLISLVPTRQGLEARFRPADSGATAGTSLYPGRTGRVSVQLALSPRPAVPSESLILDQGRWWVMLEDSNGGHAQPVEPIASNDGWTWLRGKVRAGDHILVKGAYLRFHQSFSTQYQQPD